MEDTQCYKGEKTDCAILGLWTADNYGSVLTAWSLYKELETLGYHPILVDHIGAHNRQALTGEFIRNRCNTTRAYNTSADMAELNDYIGTFIVGSDQNWNGVFLEDINGFAFYLDFVRADKRKISYATSFGYDDYRGLIEELDIVKFFLQRFDALSMRERGATKLWSEILHRNVKCVIDPIFFTSSEEYKKLAKEYIKEWGDTANGLLEFILDISTPLMKAGKSASKALGVNYKLFMGADYTIQDDLELEWDCQSHPVEEMLAVISEASYIITDSFHVMCFAIIFQKPFACIANTRGRARIESILCELSLDEKKYLVEPDEVESLNWKDFFDSQQTDWERVCARLCEWKEDSISWLKHALACQISDIEQDRNLLLMEAVDVAALGNRRASNGMKRMDVIDTILRAMNDRFDIIDRILLEHLNEINKLKRIAIKMRGTKLSTYFAERLTHHSVVAIRGGGEHTRRLLELLNETIREDGIEVKYIIDRNRLLGIDVPDGCELITPEDFWSLITDVDTVILSSAKYKKELLMEAKENNRGRYRILDPYEAFEKGELMDGCAWFD